MKRQFNILLISACISISYAHNFPDFKNSPSTTGAPFISQPQIDEIANLPQPDEGIIVISSTKMYVDNIEKNLFIALQNEYIKNGFVKRKSDDAVQLLSINKHNLMVKEKSTYLDSNNLYDSHVKQKISQIKLAFDFHPISFIGESNVLGFAVADTLIKEPIEGWTGIVEIFTDPALGTCDYKKSSAKLNHSSVHLTEDSVSYVVNKKPTVHLVEGNNKSGYSYQVDWYDTDYYHTLKCAKTVFEANGLNDVLSLANKIDIDQKI